MELTAKQKDTIGHFFIVEGDNWSVRHLTHLKAIKAPWFNIKELKRLSPQEIYDAGLEWKTEMNKKALEDLGHEIF